MSAPLWLTLPLMAVQALRAQAVNDLNSLILQADRFATAAMAAQGDPEPMALYLIRGSNGTQPGGLMDKAVHVQRWVLTYRLLTPERTAPHHGGVIQRSLQVVCEGGFFQPIVWLTVPVMDYKSLEQLWITVPLAEAIHKLNDSNFNGGFASVTIMRSLNPRYPDNCTYEFNCPVEKATVGISAQTGALLWSDTWNPVS